MGKEHCALSKELALQLLQDRARGVRVPHQPWCFRGSHHFIAAVPWHLRMEAKGCDLDSSFHNSEWLILTVLSFSVTDQTNAGHT